MEQQARIYWIGRALMMAHRQAMPDDPIIYTFTDNVSRTTVAAMTCVVLAAIWPKPRWLPLMSAANVQVSRTPPFWNRMPIRRNPQFRPAWYWNRLARQCRLGHRR